MRFHVPQFIEVEDKVFGPFTVKQFIYLAGAAGFVMILYAFLPLWLTFLIGLPVIALGGALAFYKVNNQPFSRVLEAMVTYFTSTKLYLWNQQAKKKSPAKQDIEAKRKDVHVPQLGGSKLKDLAWTLDVKESDIYSNEEQR